MSSDTKDVKLGYKNPPTWSRFKPNQSGNPNGRPSKKKVQEVSGALSTPTEFDELLRAELDRKVTINDGGKSKKMDVRALIPRAQIKAALKGNVHAQQHLMKAMHELGQRDVNRAKDVAEQLEAERQEEIASYKRITHYKAQRETEWAQAVAQESEPDDIWPHPDDILLLPKQRRWRIRGPYDETDLPFFNWCRAERDYLFAHVVLQDRLAKKAPYIWSKLYTILWISYDAKLPLRWQISGKFEIEYLKAEILTTKKLQALVDERKERSEFLKLFAGISNSWDKESYRTVNGLMKPVLKQCGYHSIAELEHHLEASGENMAKSGGASAAGAQAKRMGV